MNKLRRQLKANAKHVLNPHFKFFAALILPWFIISLLGNASYEFTMNGNFTPEFLSGTTLTFGVGILGYLTLTSIALACLNLIRGQKQFKGGIEQSTTIFHNGHYFMGSIMIGILTWIWTFLWSLLLFFPGIIKELAYSQAIFIYKDAVDNGHHIRYRDAITQSRRLMNGHKWELFVLQLSFIGWWILNFVTLSFAKFWTTPYYQLTLVNFYQNLLDNQAK